MYICISVAVRGNVEYYVYIRVSGGLCKRNITPPPPLLQSGGLSTMTFLVTPIVDFYDRSTVLSSSCEDETGTFNIVAARVKRCVWYTKVVLNLKFAVLQMYPGPKMGMMQLTGMVRANNDMIVQSG
ncbi:hypothetical protein WN55_00208 [Dufourea novaeangliae]|uniref:Uncharacterized protein n=1 Tax=Dufourea novaeangliae TaxID=178035 RepID=A0A154PCB1_DUFNO|nr:hypothetical protein WN55_00208 [Dufourea novaeangliae]